MSEANELRGEISVTLEGVEYTLRPSYEALMAIEKQTGRSIQHLALAAGDGSMSIEAAGIVVAECIKAQGRVIDDKAMAGFNAATVGEELVATGLMQVMVRLEVLLFLATTGGYTKTGERKATGTILEPTPVVA